VAAVVLGKRLGKDREVIRPHHLPMTMLGAGLLWFGWFGFNAGSALAADGIAAQAFLVTNLCAAAGVFSWVGMEWILHGKPTFIWRRQRGHLPVWFASLPQQDSSVP